MRKLIIGNKNYSSWSLRPWMLLRHLGVDFSEERIPLDTPAFKAGIGRYSDAGRVPVLVEGDLAVWDSLAICETLAERHPAAWPVEADARAHARSVVAEMHAGFEALRNELPMNCRALDRRVALSEAALTDIRRIEQIWRQCRDRYPNRGPWLFGAYSVADAFFAPVVVRFRGYRIDLAETSRAYCQAQLADPHLVAWIAAGAAEAETISHEEVGTSPTHRPTEHPS